MELKFVCGDVLSCNEYVIEKTFVPSQEMLVKYFLIHQKRHYVDDLFGNHFGMMIASAGIHGMCIKISFSPVIKLIVQGLLTEHLTFSISLRHN